VSVEAVEPVTTVSGSSSLFDSIFFTTLVLAVLVFAAGMAGYATGRIAVGSFVMDFCMSEEAIKSSGVDHFLCWYWYFWAPLLLAGLFPLAAGVSWAFLVSKLRSPGVDPVPTTRSRAYMTEQAIRDTFKMSHVRADWEAVLPAVSKNTAAVLVAGPNQMVEEIECIALRLSYAVFKESWKV
jgi:hypothetical protein